MKTLYRWFWGSLILLTAAWLWSDGSDWSTVSGFFQWRDVLTQYSGILGIGVMSFAMILAVRPVVFEPWLGGLDKMYRLHKWLGIAGLVLSIGHWAIAQVPKWLVGWGLLQKPQRGPRPVFPDGSIEQFLQSQRGLAESIGEWAFYAALILMCLALLKRFPYKAFFQTHRLLAIAYLALVWHSLILMKIEYWTTPLAPLMALLMGAGVLAALAVMLRNVAVTRQSIGEVTQITHLADLDVVKVELELHGRWPGHQAGQFAFVTFHKDEGAHPYTISSAWTGDGRLTFIIKALGDYTQTLPERLKVGEEVTVEGPYGRFDFQGKSHRQIWIGAGIGVTPFIARMKALSQAPDGKQIDLFHPTSVYDARAIELLQRDAAAAGVTLHVLWTQRDGRLTADRLCASVPEWQDADVWFCGPAAFGRSLRADLVKRGLPAKVFHQELFEMR